MADHLDCAGRAGARAQDGRCRQSGSDKSSRSVKYEGDELTVPPLTLGAILEHDGTAWEHGAPVDGFRGAQPSYVVP